MTIVGPKAHPDNRLPRLLSQDGEAAAMLVHDIRGALMGITGAISGLKRMDLPDEATEQIRRMVSASDTLAMLLDHAVEPETSAVRSVGSDRLDLTELISHLESRTKGEAASKGLDFAVLRGDGLPEGLWLNRLDFGRMIDNLLLNAVQHTGTGEVEVRIDRVEGGVDFCISDTGPGVPSEVTRGLSAGVFQSAFAGDGQHGIGLQIVRGLATKTGCRFTLESGLTGGTIARIRVPSALCMDERDTEPERVSSGSPSGLHDLSGVRILLAEDNPTNQMVACQMLGAMNASVKVVSDGVEALEEFEKGQYDLVVVDIEMPRLSGLDVIRTIRARPDSRARLPIVALTAYAMREHRDRIGEAGADGLISKPITSIQDFGRSLSGFVNLPQANGARDEQPVSNSVVKGDTEVEPVIDLEIFSELRETIGTEMLAELLEKVMTDLETSRNELVNSVDIPDRTQIRSSSHILISVGGAIGAKRLQYSARRLNTAAHQQEIGDLGDLVHGCVADIGAAMDFVQGQQRAGGHG